MHTESPADMSPKEARRWVAMLAVLLFASSVALLPSLTHYGGDERFYTDGALEMMRTGDYATPRWGDGRPRLRKPVLNYWAVLAGYWTCGVGYLGARLPSLLAGCGVVIMTGLLTYRMFGRRDAAVVAAAIVAAEMPTLEMVLRCTPDMLQSFWACVSLLGIAGLIVSKRDPDAPPPGMWVWRRDHLLWCVGAALVFATKGGLGALLMAFGVGALIAQRGWRRGWREAINGPAIAIGAFVASIWFLYMLATRGLVVIAEFAADQGGAKVGAAWDVTLKNALLYPLTYLGELLPWTLLAGGVWLLSRDRWRAFLTKHRATIVLAVAWAVTLWLVFMWGDQHRPRYLYPAHPLLAAVLGALLCDASASTRIASLIGIARHALLFGVALLGVIGAAAGWLLAPSVVYGGVALALLTGTLWFATRRRGAVFALVAVAVAMLWTERVYNHAVLPIGHENAARHLADVLAGANDSERVRVLDATGVHASVRAQVRVLSGGRIVLVPRARHLGGRIDPAFLVTPESEAGEMLGLYEPLASARDHPALDIHRLFALLVDGDTIFDESDARIYVVLRRRATDSD